MVAYFCLDDLLQRLVPGENGAALTDVFVPVQTTPPACGGYREDALELGSQPRLLDMNDPQGAYQLALLTEEVPLYQINLELLVDQILSERHGNRLVDQAITRAFEGQPIPHTMPDGEPDNPETLAGSLRHPMLGHLDKVTLAKIYLNFMRALPHGHEDYSFERHILGHHPEPFTTRFSGYIFGDHGKIRADLLLGFSTRSDYDPRRPLEDYVERGRLLATKMQITEPREMIWAWLEADHYQMRRCHDIDRLLMISGLPRTPNWVRTDVFNCLEKEAVKQVLAARLMTLDPKLSLLPRQPQIRKTIEMNAQNQIDDALQQLLSQTLTQGTQYSGAAERFYDRARLRFREAQSF